MLKIDRRMYIITTIRYIKHVGYGRGLSVRYKTLTNGTAGVYTLL